MAQHLRILFSDLRWQERLCYGALALLVVAVLSWWKLGILALGLFGTAVVVKMVTLRSWGNPGLSRGQRICLSLMTAYWLLLIASALYSRDHAAGWTTVTTQLPLLVLPLTCLITDTRYLGRTRLTALLRLMVLVLVVRFGVCIAVDIIQYLQGVPWAKLRNWEFDPLGLHHNYLAIYIDCALAFLYCDLQSRWKQLGRGQRLLHLAPAPLLIAYLVISNSRSGLVTLALLVFACLLHQTFCRRRWKLALGTGAVLVMLVVGAYLAFPQLFYRFTYIYTEYSAGRQGDDRPMLVKCGLEAAQQRLVFGHGTGDCMDALLKRYEANGFAKGLAKHYDAHNQYMETLVAEGLIGLVLLAAMLVAPVVLALRTRRTRLIVVLMITAAMMQLLFESMLDRQMGVQFVSLLYILLILLLNGSRSNAASEPQP